MAPRRKEDARKFFLKNENGKVICQVKNVIDTIEYINDSECSSDNDDGREVVVQKSVICGQEFKNDHHSTLKNHLKTKHPKEFKKLSEKEMSDSITEPPNKKIKQAKVTNYVSVTKSREVTFSLQYIENQCLKLVTIDGRPLVSVDGSAIQGLLNPYYESLKKEGTQFVPMTTYRIQQLLNQKSEYVRSAIAKLVKNKLISVKIDAATRKLRSFLGLNIQFCANGQFYLIHLACIVVNESHTGENIKNRILEILKQYKIEGEQIYLVTTDNGSNMLKTVKLLNKDFQKEKESVQSMDVENVDNEIETVEYINNSNSRNTENDNYDIINYDMVTLEETSVEDGIFSNADIEIDLQISSMIVIDDENDQSTHANNTSRENERNAVPANEIHNIIIPQDGTDTASENGLNDASSVADAEMSVASTGGNAVPEITEKIHSVSNWDSSQEVVGVRCAAHSIQIGIKNAWLNYDDESEFIDRVRGIIKKLRTKNNYGHLRKKTQLVPELDCQTRWTSTFNMIDKLLRLKNEVQLMAIDDKELYLDKIEWEKLSSLRECLLPLHKATIKLQKNDLNFADFFVIIRKCTQELKKCNHPFSSKLQAEIVDKENLLFSNIAFLTVMFLHPELRCYLESYHEIDVREHIVKIHNKLQDLLASEKNRIEEQKQTESGPAGVNDTESESDVEYSDSDEEFRRQTKIKRKQRNLIREMNEEERQKKNVSIIEEIDKFCIREKKLSKTKIIKLRKYWYEKREIFPLLSEVEMVVLGVPCTQVSVERLFSSLRFIVSDLRVSLEDERVKQILLLRENPEFWV